MLYRGRKKFYREFWALKNIALDIRAGETVGIVGRNGSGKSTLLQLICGTLTPTSGEVRTSGRVAALLELGSGFNPEFTGRENVYLYSSILGVSREETTARFNDIAAFADIGDFIDQPIKVYSSGMVVRLAFAVAISVDPEILIVDEALSVGDELFQRKCFSKIEQLKARGTTILFVSHSAATVIELCDRAVLVDSGELIQQGMPKKIVGLYQRILYAPEHQHQEIRSQAKLGYGFGGAIESKVAEEPLVSQTPKQVSGDAAADESFFDPNLLPQSTVKYESHGAVISNPTVYTLEGHRANCLVPGGRYRYTYEVNFSRAASGVYFGMLIKTTSGINLGGCSSGASPDDRLPFVPAQSSLVVSFEFVCILNPGVYYLNAGVLGEVDGESRFLHRILDALVVRVLPSEKSTATEFVDFGIVPSVRVVSEGGVARYGQSPSAR
jgi:lipopolysaccharide transport system ATP-binding protein